VTTAPRGLTTYPPPIRGLSPLCRQ
jgi:hypothetical protein